MVKPRQELLGNINNLDKDLTGTVTLNNANIQSTKSIIFYPIGLAPAVNSVWVESGATTYLKFTDNNGNTITLGSGSPAQSWSDVLSIDPYSNGYNPIISNGDYLYFKKIDSSNISISSDGYNLNINGSDNIIFELSNGFILRFPQNDGYYGYALTTDGYGNLSFNPTTNTPLSDVISPNIDASIAVVGIDGYAARADHTHQVNVDSPVDLIVGGSNIDGYSSYLARADHIHALPAFGTTSGTFTQGNDSRLSDDRTASGLRTASSIVSISGATAPILGQVLVALSSSAASWSTLTASPFLTSSAPSNVTKSAAAVGTDGYAARADHKHDISTATASSLSVGGSNSEGTSTSLARADHTHSLPAFGTIAGTFAQGNDSRFINPGTDGYILSTQSGLVTWSGRVNIGSTVSVIPTSSFDSKVVFDNYTVGSPRAWLIPYGTTPTTTNFCIDGNGSVSRLNGSVNSILSVSGSTVLFADATGVGLYKPLVFQANVIAPAIRQNANPTGNGQPLEMYAQQSGDSAGGNLNLHSGLGSTIDGYINLYTGNNIRAAINTSIELYPTIGSNKIIINDSGTSGSVAQWMLPVATSASTGNWAIKSNGSTSYINGSSSSGLYVNDTLKLSASSTTIGVYNSSIAFDSILSPVSIFQYATAAGDGSDFSISAQTSVIASGGDLILSSGSGTSYLTDGYWKARTGSSDRISISPSEVSIYPLSGTNKIIIGDTSGAVTQWMLPDATSKTASNYAIISNGSNTYINGTTSVHFRLNNNSSAYISGSGFVFNTAQVSFSSDLPSPTITQFTKSSGAGETLVLQAQSSSDNTGGILRLRSGTGVTTNGALQLWTGATQRFEASDFVTINPTTAADSKAVFANYGAGTPALWLGALALTPTSSNYAITSSGSNTYINATANVSLRLSNSPTLFIDSSGVGLYKSVAFQSSVLSPSIGQNSIPTGVGQTLSISAQGSGDSAGGDFILSSGDGYASANDGSIRLRTSTNDRVLLSGVWSTGNASPIKFWPGQRTYFASFEEVSTALNLYMAPDATTTTGTNYTIRSNSTASILNGTGSSSLGVNGTPVIQAQTGLATVIGNISFSIAHTSPIITHTQRTAGVGETLLIQAQSTQDSNFGGDLKLAGGMSLLGGDGYHGEVAIYHSTTEKARWYRNGKLKIANVIFPASRGGAGTMPRIADVSGNIEWITPSGTGDVVGPASSTNLAIPVFDGLTGKAIKESVATIDASGNISGILNINKRRVAGVSSNVSIDTSVGDYYFIGTLTGNITITLPVTPSAGEQYIIKDSAGYLNTYSVTIDGNGNNIDGQATQIMNIQYMAITLIYNGTSWDIV